MTQSSTFDSPLMKALSPQINSVPFVSQQNIHFLSPKMLIEMIYQIETRLGGWWWSISQKSEGMTLSTGPGRNCLDLRDIAFSLTKEGDAGCHHSSSYISAAAYQTYNVKEWMDPIISFFLTYRDETLTKYPEIQPSLSQMSCRRQHDNQLIDLYHQYLIFLSNLNMIENHGHILREVYLGSCDLSVDCSLRGKRQSNGKDFDISIDIQGHLHSLADSLGWALAEIKSNILTPQ